MNRKLTAIFYHSSLNESISQSISKQHKFMELCEDFPTDWAHLIDLQTGEVYMTKEMIADSLFVLEK